MAPTRIALCLAAMMAPTAWQPSLANPTGPSVVNGTASFAASGSTLTVTNSPNAIINWQSFSIGAGEITRFNQQSAMSAVLNRVTTQNPSAILGALQSNGRVFLINPSGILFGAGSQVDVAGLIASTLNLSNADFLAGRLRFTSTPGAGAVVNNGTITTTGANAPVYLIGPAVTNGGIITGTRGEVLLAAGQTVEVAEPGTPNLRVEITAPNNEALNLGTIFMQSGRINIYAGIIRQNNRLSVDGNLFADHAALTADARIVLRASGKGLVSFGPGSMTSARISTGADIEPGYPVEVTGSDIHVAGIVSTGQQTVHASRELSLASSIESRALLIAVGGQTISAGSLTASTQGEAANIENYGGAQIINVTGDITINAAATPRFGIFGVFSDQQAISARNISLTNTDIFASENQLIQATGNVTLTNSTIAGAGELGFPTFPGTVTLDVGGNLEMAGGSSIEASELNPVSVTADGSIAFNDDSTLRTAGNILLAAGRITQNAASQIAGDGLRIAANGDASLPGLNQVASFGGTSRGGVTFNNVSPILTVTGLQTDGHRPLSLTQNGHLTINGDVTSGAQAIHASGNILISPGGTAGITVYAGGPQSIQSGGDMTIQGGTGSNAFSLVTSTRDIELTVGGLLRLSTGGAPGASAGVQTLKPNGSIGLRFPNRSSGGWFVDGVGDAITSGDSGFFSGAGAAVLGETLFVTHGGE